MLEELEVATVVFEEFESLLDCVGDGIDDEEEACEALDLEDKELVDLILFHKLDLVLLSSPSVSLDFESLDELVLTILGFEKLVKELEL